MLLVGSFPVSIDDKGRLMVPSEWRGRWDPSRDGEGWYCVPWTGRRLRLFTQRRFEGLLELDRASQKLAPTSDETELLSALCGEARFISPDSAGRLTIPKDLTEFVRLGKEITLVGLGTFVEVRDRAEWNASREQRLQSLQALVERRDHPRA